MPIPSTCTPAFLHGLPKAELHVHLEGCLEPDLKLVLSRRNNIPLAQTTEDQIRETYKFDSLASFLAVYYGGIALLQTEQDFYELALSYFRRVSTEGIRRCEAFFDPQAHISRGIAIKDVINGCHRACVEAKGLGISAALILCFLREESAESAMETLEAALEFRDKFIGIGLDSDERGNPPAKFAAVYARARKEGLKLTAHADIDQPNSIEHIRQALMDIGVDRLDHGTNIVESPALVAHVVEKKIGLTCCPISNSFVTPTMKAPEMVELMGKNVLVTINSDDPAYMLGEYCAENYVAIANKAGLSPMEMVGLAKNSFKASWASDEEKKGWVDEVDRFVDGWKD